MPLVPCLVDTQVHTAIRHVITHSKDIAHTYDREKVNPELEVRFGHVTDRGAFVPGMTRTALSKLEHLLDTNRDWFYVSEWNLMHAFTHPSGIVGDHRTLRSEVAFVSDAQRDVTTIEKKPIHVKTFAIGNESRPVSFRIAVAMEVNVPTNDIPPHTEPTHCTIKRRKVYTYTPADHDKPAWMYCLTQRWHGRTFVDALVSVNTDEPICDLELEIVDVDYILHTDDEVLATKLLWKMNDLIEAIAASYNDMPVVSNKVTML